jgi:tRNA wybutosine-synthesizing protein 1
VALFNCENKCLHCWRNTDYSLCEEIKDPEDPEKIIDGLISERAKLMNGFPGNPRVDEKKMKEALEPNFFTFSLTGEATLYPKLGEMIKLLRKRKIITFLVTNGLNPSALEKLEKERSLPTQLTISLNTSNEKLFSIWHRSSKKDAWSRLNKSLDLMKKLKGKCRRAIRLNLVKKSADEKYAELSNMEPAHVKEYAELIRKAMPDFIHVDGFKSIGSARERMSWKKMPNFEEVKEFALQLLKELPKEYKIAGEEPRSAIVMISNLPKKELKIKKV